MGLFNRKRRSPAAITAGAVRLQINNYIAGMGIDDLYATQPSLQAVVSFVAQNIAQLPVKVYRKGGGDNRERDTDGVAARLFSDLGDGMTAYELLYATVADYKLYGIAIWAVLPSADTASGYMIRRIPQRWVLNTITADGFNPSGYVVRNPEGDGTEQMLDASRCVVFKMYNPADPATALSPVEALKDILNEQMNAWAYRNKVWENGGWVSRYIERPADSTWSPEARKRFAVSWKEKFAGRDGVDSGGTPILEDGMKLVTTPMDSDSAQWADAAKLAREDVAAAYHINPSLIWNMATSTYASAKDNARSLYADTLGTDIKFLTDKMNASLLPLIGAEPDTYIELDIQAKLAGDFESQTRSLQASVGAPWMTRNEARTLMNLPRMDDGDELITPLNVITGGLASPLDTGDDGMKQDGAVQTKSADKVEELESKSAPEDDISDELTVCLIRFFKRQRKKVEPAIDSAKSRKDATASWWDGARWDKELAEDLYPIMLKAATRQGERSIQDFGLPRNSFSRKLIQAYMRKMAEGKAHSINQITYEQLMKALEGGMSAGAQGSTVRGVFDKAETTRALSNGKALNTHSCNWATMEAAKQAERNGVTGQYYKTWHNNGLNIRPSHLKMNGETVPRDEEFSNTAQYPCDGFLPDEEKCNCKCTMTVSRR